MDGRMKVAGLGVDPRIAATLEDQGIEGFYPPQECAAPTALESVTGRVANVPVFAERSRRRRARWTLRQSGQPQA